MTQIPHIIRMDEDGCETVLYCPGMGNETDGYHICEDCTEDEAARTSHKDEIIMHGVKHLDIGGDWMVPTCCGPCEQVNSFGKGVIGDAHDVQEGVFEVTLEWFDYWEATEVEPVSEAAAKLILEQQERIKQLEAKNAAHWKRHDDATPKTTISGDKPPKWLTRFFERITGKNKKPEGEQ